MQTFLQMMQAGMAPGHFYAMGVNFAMLIEPPSALASSPLITVEILRECAMHSDTASPVRTIPRRWDARDWVVGMRMSATDLIRLKELCPNEELVGPEAYLETFGIHPILLAEALGLYRRGQVVEDLSIARQSLLAATGLCWDQVAKNQAKPLSTTGTSAAQDLE